MADRVIRRVVLGDGARDDTGLTADLDRLRNAANWAYLRPRNEGLRAAVVRTTPRRPVGRREADAPEPGRRCGLSGSCQGNEGGQQLSEGKWCGGQHRVAQGRPQGGQAAVP